MKTRRRIASLASVAGIAALGGATLCMIHLPACDGDDGAHTYEGDYYVEARDCLGTSSTIDVVPGPDPGQCDPKCMVQPQAEGGPAVYVATMCPPYPQPDWDFTGTNPDCPKALAALARQDICFDDGGSENPAVDAGPDAPDATDAGDAD